jgi:hypothetical protein
VAAAAAGDFVLVRLPQSSQTQYAAPTITRPITILGEERQVSTFTLRPSVLGVVQMSSPAPGDITIACLQIVPPIGGSVPAPPMRGGVHAQSMRSHLVLANLKVGGQPSLWRIRNSCG